MTKKSFSSAPKGTWYDKYPAVRYKNADAAPCAWAHDAAWATLAEAAARKKGTHADGARFIIIDCYPGVDTALLKKQLASAFADASFIDAERACIDHDAAQAMIARNLTDDRVFGIMSHFRMEDFFDAVRLAKLREEAARLLQENGMVVLIGTGALYAAGELREHPAALAVYADMPRWEIQLRMRAGMSNWLAENPSEDMLRKYKRGYFVEWRTADRHKKEFFGRIDFFLDTTERDNPKLVAGDAMRGALAHTARRPFRVKPFFDPGVWGGQWLKEVCDLDRHEKNYAWGFDCVPEENSLLIDFGAVRVEVPSINVVFFEPVALLGDKTHARFGTEFPIRVDFLDTMDGQHLSLQVHPLTEYIYETFGMAYTQDESYYMLDAADGACVYLGLKEGVNYDAMIRDLRRAQAGEISFPDEQYVNRLPAKKHDHFLIPAGTVHCSGKNSVVLEISATPYIFTFKLWDWDRVGMDGKPRPVHIDHGSRVIQKERTTPWVAKNLVNRFELVAEGPGWKEERTGLHEREFIETRRHTFTAPVHFHTRGTVQVLCLVDGQKIFVHSPQGLFEDMEVRYAETFIVPASVGEFVLIPKDETGAPCMTMNASVRGTECL